MNSVFEIILQRLRKRILIYVAMNFVLVVLLILFSEYWLTRGFDVSAVGAEYNNVRNPIASMNYFSKIVAIFSNNYFIALLFIIPALSFLFLIGVIFIYIVVFCVFFSFSFKLLSNKPICSCSDFSYDTNIIS